MELAGGLKPKPEAGVCGHHRIKHAYYLNCGFHLLLPAKPQICFLDQSPHSTAGSVGRLFYR